MDSTYFEDLITENYRSSCFHPTFSSHGNMQLFEFYAQIDQDSRVLFASLCL